MEDADEEQGTAIENVPQQGVQAPIRTFEAGVSNSGVSLSGSLNINNSTIYMSTPSENRGNRSLKPSPSVDIDTIEFTELKEYYKTTLCQASPLPWYPEYTWDIDEVYTELSLQNAVTSKFGVEELFKHAHEHSRKGGSYRVLIEGDAGFGKSTLMLKIASDWSKRYSNDHTEYTSPFSILFVVKLGYVGEDENLLSYMELMYNEKMETPLKDVLKSKAAEEVLILLDGYDEANTNTKKEVGRIMVKEMMSKCHVVLTSRCGHVPDAVKSKALRVTVKGFGPRQVTVAVGKFFIKARHLTKDDVISCVDELSTPNKGSLWLHDSIVLNSDDFQNVQEIFPLPSEEKRLGLDQFKKFMKKVQDESPYKELAQCPLLCVMLCCLVSECPNGELPSTCSGLYFAMINRNLHRAARKKAEAAGKDEEQWNWDELDSRIRQGHESYLQEFGCLCAVGLQTGSMSFSLFDITGNKEAAKTTDVKVTRLIEAGVLVQDSTELNTKEKIPRYQVPHRTTAEFLAAYYLSGETDQNLLQRNFLDLFRLKASFNEVAVSLLEMGKPGCLVDAFRDIKFPSNCLTDNPFMKSYFTQHGAAGTGSEFKDALPNKLEIKTLSHIISVSSSELCLTLQVIEELGKMITGNTNPLRSLLPKDCLVSLRVERTPSLPILLQTLVKSGVVLNSLEFSFIGRISYQIQKDVVRSLQELLKTGSCPVQLSFKDASADVLLAVTEAMQEVPEACRLTSFKLFHKRGSPDTSLSKVLAEKWLSHLQHLGVRIMDSQSGVRVNPILKGLREPGCSLTSLHLHGYYGDNNGDMVLEDLMMLATKLVTLRLEKMKLCFDVTRIRNAVKEKCSLKSLHLKKVSLVCGLLPSADENKELLLGWRNVALHLEELTIDRCEFPVELFSWLNLSVPNLRTLSIGRVVKTRPNRDYYYANQLLEALTRSSGESIEELSLLEDVLERNEVLVREDLERCPVLKKVQLKIFSMPYHSTPLSYNARKALSSANKYSALLRIVLRVPMLQTFTSEFFFMNWKEIGTFHAIADKAEKWPGKGFDNEWNTLTLHGLSNENACHAMHVFRERGLKHCLSYVAEEVYELWFPV